jgi:hypothetical protein
MTQRSRVVSCDYLYRSNTGHSNHSRTDQTRAINFAAIAGLW